MENIFKEIKAERKAQAKHCAKLEKDLEITQDGLTHFKVAYERTIKERDAVVRIIGGLRKDQARVGPMGAIHKAETALKKEMKTWGEKYE
ncbi:hypothetical protein GWO43_16150 [candidate division KSB1 bacterium]|nr:hypothetical protein [candidate division KSB1 bacterium]NIV68766.1 hypothetical protein [Phycisphaerae bacterium]NIS25483.1 hypothetical protein [candidate division KSB1 bacterium]NIT72376.1 hypothetical protein [candidate division KSB1 bacterium]NIU26160.1 hypothetical protein [candidate division KSB1 bacterium]